MDARFMSTGSQPTATSAGLASREASLLTLICLACLIPFSGKPFNMDDPLFVWAAEHITTDPLDFYGFDVNWYGYEYPIWKIMKNPPLCCYYLAAFGSLLGFGEFAMHLALLIPNLAVALGTYFLARRFTRHAFWAALFTLFTPVVLVSSLTVMCDMLMLACWIWAIVAWLAALESDRLTLFLLSGVLITASMLTKYFGIAAAPLLLAYTLFERRRPGLWLFGLAIPLVSMTLYDWSTMRLYGRPLMRDAADYAHFVREVSGPGVASGLLHGMFFLGGCYVSLLAFAPALWSWGWQITGVLAGIATSILLRFFGWQAQLFADPTTGESLVNSVHFAIFTVAALNVLALVLADIIYQRNRDSLFLMCWIGGGLVFALFLNWAVNARTLLVLAPACGILVARRIEAVEPELLRGPMRRIAIWFAPAVVVSMAILWGDYSLAQSIREAARRLTDKYIPQSEPLWFEGHWGFQFYMQEFGATAVDYADFNPSGGELLVIPSNNTCILILPADVAKPIETGELPASTWESTVKPENGVNFYSGARGNPLPYVFTRIGPERYTMYEIQRDLHLEFPRPESFDPSAARP